jgi:hypothetical protein
MLLENRAAHSCNLYVQFAAISDDLDLGSAGKNVQDDPELTRPSLLTIQGSPVNCRGPRDGLFWRIG